MRKIRKWIKKWFENFLNRGRSGKSDDWIFLNLASFGVLGIIYYYHNYKIRHPERFFSKKKYRGLHKRYVRL